MIRCHAKCNKDKWYEKNEHKKNWNLKKEEVKRFWNVFRHQLSKTHIFRDLVFPEFENYIEQTSPNPDTLGENYNFSGSCFILLAYSS